MVKVSLKKRFELFLSVSMLLLLIFFGGREYVDPPCPPNAICDDFGGISDKVQSFRWICVAVLLVVLCVQAKLLNEK